MRLPVFSHAATRVDPALPPPRKRFGVQTTATTKQPVSFLTTVGYPKCCKLRMPSDGIDLGESLGFWREKVATQESRSLE